MEFNLLCAFNFILVNDDGDVASILQTFCVHDILFCVRSRHDLGAGNYVAFLCCLPSQSLVF